MRRIEQTYITSKVNPHIEKASKFNTPEFKINHYAGEVIYKTEGFVEKNKDAISDTMSETLQSSNHPLMQILFPPVQKTAARRNTKKVSLSSQFSQSLNTLINTIDESVPRYVRCIKPNKIGSSKAADIDTESVQTQLRAASILEAVRIRNMGYGYRIEYQEFADKFWPIIEGRIYDNVDQQIVTMVFKKAALLNTGED